MIVNGNDRWRINLSTKLLLVEDDNQIREIIIDYFISKFGEEIIIDEAATGDIGREKIASEDYDLVILDVMLPGIDGFSLCRSIRRKSDVPIIFLTARSREEDVLFGYELGCDDYICKPFSLPELMAKSKALLNRTKGLIVKKEYVCGNITLNPLTLIVSIKGNEIDLPPKEFELLAYLMEHKGWVVTRQALLENLWGADYFGGTRVVDNHIKKLRKLLENEGSHIKTVISKGYKLTD